MHVNLEVVSIPMSDVYKALEFYHDRLGWRLDADIRAGDDFRVVQITPTGNGHTSGAPVDDGAHVLDQSRRYIVDFDWAVAK